MQRQSSSSGHAAGVDAQQQQPRRTSNTPKKRASVRRSESPVRPESRRSMEAGSVRSIPVAYASTYPDPREIHSAFFCPVPTTGSPTDVLVMRFQVWRKLLKDLIVYFREVQAQYEQRAKSFSKLSNVASGNFIPQTFLRFDGIDDAFRFIREYNRNAIMEAQKAKEIEEDVIMALAGLRTDLQQKIKEIKHLASDFKNSIDKEMQSTAKHIRALSAVLEKSETDIMLTNGKQDPYLLRLAVDRQIERQIEEENYLHQAYLNIEGSGRELESVVVGEVQKAYHAYVGILRREADIANGLANELTEGPISMPLDREWMHFVRNDNRVLDPAIPLRSPEQIRYPGQDHCAATEIRSGLLERKSKYLKSYTAGWYVLSTTHLHEFKSADKAQTPVMSLYLPEQTLGSRSNKSSSSNKFVLKGKQIGAMMHRGHAWVFRAESHETMMAWYEDIRALTQTSPEERSDFVLAHSRRSMSGEFRRSASSDGFEEEEEDEEPFQGTGEHVGPGLRPEPVTRRSQPGGRFPSDMQINAQRGNAELGHSSGESSQDLQLADRAVAPVAAASGAAPEASSNGMNESDGPAGEDHMAYGSTGQTLMQDVHSQAAIAGRQARLDSVNPYTSEPVAPAQAQTEVKETANDENYYMMSNAAPQGHPGPPNGNQYLGDEADHNRNKEAVYHPGVDDDKTIRASKGSEPRGSIAGLQGQLPNGPTGETSKPRAAEGTGSTANPAMLHVPGEFPQGGAGSR